MKFKNSWHKWKVQKIHFNRVEDAVKKIQFKNKGQKLLWLIVNESGRIIDSNTQKDSWCGMRLHLEKLKVGESILFLDSADDSEFGVEIEKIESLTAEERKQYEQINFEL